MSHTVEANSVSPDRSHAAYYAWAGGLVLAVGFTLLIWCFGPLLVSRWGSLGGCYTILAASAIFAGYLTWRLQRVMTYSLRKWVLSIALGLLFLPLVWLQSSWTINVVLYGVFVIGYCTSLLLFRLITRSELVAVAQAFRSKRKIFNKSKSAGDEYLDRS